MEPIELSYSWTPDDFVAIRRCELEYRADGRRKPWWQPHVAPAGCALVAVVFLVNAVFPLVPEVDRPYHRIASLAAAIGTAWGAAYRYRIGAIVRKQFARLPADAPLRKPVAITLSSTGVRAVNNGETIEFAWPTIARAVLLPDHILLRRETTYLVIPRRAATAAHPWPQIQKFIRTHSLVGLDEATT